MKKIAIVGLVLQSLVAFSQVSFNPGVRAGLNISKFTGGEQNHRYFGDNLYINSSDYTLSSIVDFYVGFQGNIRFNQKYALQPELNYSRQGTEISDSKGLQHVSHRLSASYIGIDLVNKFYIQKFNLHVAPTFSVLLDKKGFVEDMPIDFGFLAGIGYDINKNIGVEARVKRGIIPVVNSHSNFTIQLGAYYTF